jgi:hydrogenase expression/formation protein HypE
MLKNNTPNFEGASCPMPLQHNEQIVMGHGSGGKMTNDLIKNVFMPRLSSEPLSAGNDFAKTSLPEIAGLNGHLSISTDAHIVAPLKFPGGDIGRLAVCGTVNDVSMSGAIPLYLTANFILEEGLPIKLLEEIVDSMQEAAAEANVQIVAGDTKVAEKGSADQIFITTSGIGWIPNGRQINGAMAKPGDVVIISGTIGDHGIAVLGARGDLGFETDLKSDVAPLNHLIADVITAAPNTHVLRDPTRGGVATTLNEIAVQSNVNITLEESNLPVLPAVNAACELLGFDPLYVANEGKLLVILPENEADAALTAMRKNKYGKNAQIIGRVEKEPQKRVLIKTQIGGTRLLDVMAGEMLPRIC